MSEREEAIEKVAVEAASDVEHRLADWGPDYVAALKELAGSAGVTPLDLHDRVSARIAASAQTAECLSLEELDQLLADRLPQSRRDHLARCSFCTEVVGLMEQSSPAAQGTFVGRATTISQRAVSGRIGFVSGFVAGGVIGAAIARMTKRKPASAERDVVKAQE